MSLDLTNGHIDLTHGSGGRNSYRLIQEVFSQVFRDPLLQDKNSHYLRPEGEIVVSTDSYVISPIFFPGGDIGSLAVHGTVNDLAMMGAHPIGITLSLILEEGFSLSDLYRISHSIQNVLNLLKIPLLGGDTKVVEKGKGDKIFINTTGIGVLPQHRERLSLNRITENDDIIINGTIGDHGLSILAQRAQFQFKTEVQSDSAPLNEICEKLLSKFSTIKYMQDPTRGGLSGCLNEISHQTKYSLRIQGDRLPVHPQVHGGCELLGLDPLHLANEGKFILFCSPTESQDILQTLREHSLGKNAEIIGHVSKKQEGKVILETPFGGSKIMTWISGDQLPRIC